MARFSTHVVLLEDRQGQCGAGNYCVTFSGSRAQCLALDGTVDNGMTAPWRMADFAATPAGTLVMRDPNNNPLPGVITKLTYIQSVRAAYR